MKHYEYILLDWDGNLADTLAIWLQASREVLMDHGHELTKAEIGRNFTEPRELYQELGLPNPSGIIQRRQDIVVSRMPEAELYPDSLEVLEHLKAAGKRLALVTSSPRVAVLPALTRHRLDDMFDAVVTGDDVTRHKPDPEPLEQALTLLGGTTDQAVMIGDTDADIISARRLGIDSIAFMPPQHAQYYHFESILKHRPTHTVSDFREIMNLIH